MRSIRRTILLSALALLSGCVHRAPPGPRPLEGLGRVLAVLPTSTGDQDRADRALAAAQVIVTALEAQQPALIPRDLESLVSRSGPGGACLLEPEYSGACLASLYRGRWLEVIPEGDRMALKLHGGIDAGERDLSPIAVDEPVEVLSQRLREALNVSLAPPPSDLREIPPVQTGVCLNTASLSGYGSGLRSLLLARTRTGDEAKTTREGAIAQLEAAHGPSPTLLVEATLARAYLETGDAPKALALFPDPLPPRCGLAPALAARGRVLMKLERQMEGVADLGMSARHRPFNDQALADWAEGLTREDRWADAAQVYQRVVALTPTDLTFRRQLADVLATEGRSREARTVLIEGLEHLPAPPERAWIELDLARLDEADSAWQKAGLHDQRGLALLGDDGDPSLRASLLNGLGVAQNEVGDPKAAEKSLEQAIALRRAELAHPRPETRERLATSLYNLGLVLAKQQRWEATLQTLNEAADLFEGDERLTTWLDLARLLQQGGRSKLALEVLDRMRKTVPELEGVLEAEWLYLHGLSEYGVGRNAVALTELEQAAGKYGEAGRALEEGLAWFNLANIALEAGERARAVEAYGAAREIAVQLGDSDSVTEIDRRLEGLEPPKP